MHTSIAVVFTQVNCFNLLLSNNNSISIISLNSYKFCYSTLTIQLNIRKIIKQFFFKQFSLTWVIRLQRYQMSNNPIWPIERALSSVTTPSQSEPKSNSNERVFCIAQSFSITRVSPSDCLVSYARTLVLPLYRNVVGLFESPSQQGCQFHVQLNICRCLVVKESKQIVIEKKKKRIFSFFHWILKLHFYNEHILTVSCKI